MNSSVAIYTPGWKEGLWEPSVMSLPRTPMHHNRHNKFHYYTLNSLTLFWLAEIVLWIFEISARDAITADYTIIMSRTLKITGNHVKLARFVFSSRQWRSKNMTFFFVQCIMTSHVVFGQGQFLMLLVVCFQWPICLWQGMVTILGLHILIEVLLVIYKVLRRFLCSCCQLYTSANPALCLLCLLKCPRDLTRINPLTITLYDLACLKALVLSNWPIHHGFNEPRLSNLRLSSN